MIGVSLAACFSSLPASAGSFTAINSGGTAIDSVTPRGYSTGSATPFAASYSHYTGSATANLHTGSDSPVTTSTCKEQITTPALTTTFTWVPAYAGEVPPTAAIVVQTCNTVSSWTTPSGDATGSGTADNGLKSPPVTTGAGSGTTTVTSSGTLYSAGASVGASFTATCSAAATSSGYTGTQEHTGGQYVVSADYQATASPITISLGGAILDSSGNLNILVGQGCTASLAGIPSACTVSNYQWSVTGTTFQNWSPTSPNNTSASYEIDGPGPLNQQTAFWYWDDLQQTQQETVSCTVTVTPPSGQGTPFPVSVTQTVTVLRPTWTAEGDGGSMQINTSYDEGNGTDYWLYAGYPNLLGGLGMIWDATVQSPNSALFGNGSISIAQLITPDSSYTFNFFGATATHSDPYNGQIGLDSEYPYGWISPSPPYTAGDAPGLDITNNLSAQMNDQFEDYLMYTAPGLSLPVPLAYFVWSASGNVTLPKTGGWAKFTGSPGTINPSNQTTQFSRTGVFPTWTIIIPSPTNF